MSSKAMKVAMENQQQFSELLQNAIVAETTRSNRRGILFLIIGVMLGIACYQLMDGPAPTLTEENMFDLGNPNILYQYGMWASGLITYTGGMMIYSARSLRKKFEL